MNQEQINILEQEVDGTLEKEEDWLLHLKQFNLKLMAFLTIHPNLSNLSYKFIEDKIIEINYIINSTNTNLSHKKKLANHLICETLIILESLIFANEEQFIDINKEKNKTLINYIFSSKLTEFAKSEAKASQEIGQNITQAIDNQLFTINPDGFKKALKTYQPLERKPRKTLKLS